MVYFHTPNYILRIKIAAVRARILRLLRLGIWPVLFSARVFHRDFCNRVLSGLIIRVPTSIRRDTLFYYLARNVKWELNGKDSDQYCSSTPRESILFFGNRSFLISK